MKADTQIAPPKNWPDFETLCMKLWGEIWNCSDTIIKNGRSGQSQNGVDVSGAPNDGAEYYGIQCKGKDKYIHAQLTTKEIDGEIEKARNFIPPLKQFIFATTAVKDANIEEYIRLKNIESQQQGGFSIHLFSWEDIVEKLKERRNTYNWYMNDCQYIDNSDVEVEVSSDENELHPQLYKTTKKYLIHPYPEGSLQRLAFGSNNVFGMYREPIRRNYGWCNLFFNLKNTGSTMLTDYHLILGFIEGVEHCSYGESYCNNQLINATDRAYINNKIDNEAELFASDQCNGAIEYRPKIPNLVQCESKSFKIRVLPKLDAKEIHLGWVLLSNGYKKVGELTFKVDPQIEENEKVIYVDSENELKPETTVLEYKIIEK